jgi:hypothetical protein
MPNLIRPDDLRLTWQGAISLEVTDSGVVPWRLPFEELGLYPPEALQERAVMPAGVRVSFQTDTASLIASMTVESDDPQFVDVYCDGEFFVSLSANGKHEHSVSGLPDGQHLIEMWLPQHGKVKFHSLQIDDDASIEPYDDTRPKWVTYGSSITHCRAAASPSMTWPAIVARDRGLNLTCLGYGGNCHLEPMLARMIRDLPADYLSMKVGINIQGSQSLNIRTFKPAIIGFFSIVREKHPDTPFAVASPIFSPPRETTRNVVDFSLSDMREEVADAVELLKAQGDSNLHYVDGLKLFGPEYEDMLPDELHPHAKGYEVLAQNFVNKVAKPLFT